MSVLHVAPRLRTALTFPRRPRLWPAPRQGSATAASLCPKTRGGRGHKPPLSFTQPDIGDGSVHCVTAPGRQDGFSLGGMRGSQAGEAGVGVSVDRPRWVPLKAQNLTVREGGSEARLGDAVRVSSHCFEGFDCKFVLHKPPQHGHVEKSHFPGVKLMKFTRK